MSDAFSIGALAMRTQQQALEALANNIANVNTSGFKRARVRFSDLSSSAAANGPATAADAGVRFDSQIVLDQQGELQRTGRPLDLAIEGAGFIELMGPGGQTLLWRGGGLKVDAEGLLATDSGLALRAAVSVPADATGLAIARDGTVRATLPDSSEPVELGRIELVRCDDPASLTRIDGGFYRMADDARSVAVDAGEDGAGLLVQGAVERSNVQLTDEMVQLMLVQRAYAANAQIVQAADQLMGIANGLRR
jgi:flagellar basal-body rod protein FlgG